MNSEARVKLGALAPITSEKQLLAGVNSIISTLIPLVGQHPNKNEKVVQWADLLASGLISGLTFGPNGDISGIVPDPVLPDVTVPPAIVDFTAVASFNFVTLSWEQPRYKNHSYVEVWRAPSFKKDAQGADVPTTLSDAVFRFMTTSIVSSDTVLPGDFWRYWARNVSKAGVTGPWTSVDGLSVSVPESPSYLIDKISGEIREGDLYPALGDKIDVSYVGVNEHTALLVLQQSELQKHTSELQEHTSALQKQADELLQHTSVLQGQTEELAQHTSELQKQADALAQHGTVLAEHTQTISSQGASITQQGIIVTDHTALLTQHTSQITQNNNSIVEQSRILTTHESTLVSHSQTLATQNSAIAELKTITETHDATLVSHSQTLTTQGASIGDLRTITQTHDGVLAQHTSQITTANANITSVTQIVESQGRTLAEHTQTISSQGASITQQGVIVSDHTALLAQHTSQITQNKNSIVEQSRILTTHESTLVSHSQTLATQNSSIAELKTITETHESTLVSHSQTLVAQGASIGDLRTITQIHDATLVSHSQTLATQNSSIAELKTITETHDGVLAQHTSQITTANSNITSVTQIVESQGRTLAEHTQILASHGTAIQQQAQINTDQGALINASWTVRIDSGNAVSGFGLMVDGATGRSDFIVRADRFAIAAPQLYDQAGKPIVNTNAFPFIVDVTNPASPKILIKNAYIDQAFIQTLVTGSLVADRITGQTLTGTHIRGGDMVVGSNFNVDGAGSMTALNAFLRGTMQSSNYGAGVSGWQIHNNGNAEFNTAVVRGIVYATGGWFQGTVYAEKMVGGAYTKRNYGGGYHVDNADANWRTALRVTVARGMAVVRKLELSGTAGHFNMTCVVEGSGSGTQTRRLYAEYEVRVVRDGVVVEAFSVLGFDLSATSNPSSGPVTTRRSGGLGIGLIASVPSDSATHFYDLQFRFVRTSGDAGSGSSATAGCNSSDGSTVVMYIENGDLA